jgi:hypothetical protein
MALGDAGLSMNRVARRRMEKLARKFRQRGPMMKMDLERKLKDPKGAEFTDGATIAMAAYNALTVALPSDQQGSTPETALKRYRLIQTIAKGGVQDLSAEDIAEIKKRAATALSIIAFGSLCDALESRAEIVEIQQSDQKPEAAA